ncbi:MAG: hypothetical protein RIQ65_97 [Pseudomonadota bacterium]
MSIMKEINEWLDDEVVVYPSDPHRPILEPKYYYTENELKKFYSKKKSKVIINDRTRRNDANNIFCELVDYCAKYGVYDGENLLANPSNKNSFYNFIYENSRK